MDHTRKAAPNPPKHPTQPAVPLAAPADPIGSALLWAKEAQSRLSYLHRVWADCACRRPKDTTRRCACRSAVSALSLMIRREQANLAELHRHLERLQNPPGMDAAKETGIAVARALHAVANAEQRHILFELFRKAEKKFLLPRSAARACTADNTGTDF